MLPNYWYPIVFSRALRAGRPLPVRRGGLDLVLFRDASGQARCLLDRCPHRGVPLRLGRVRDGRIVCGYHGFEFTGEGSCVHMPCAGVGARIPGGMDVSSFVVREQDGIVWLFWGEDARAEQTPIARLQTAAAFDGAHYDSTLEWPLHYANSLENNFDVHHFNFVHVSQAWMFRIPDRIDEVRVDRRDDGLDFIARMVPETGRGRGPQEFRVEYRAPSLQAIVLGERTLVTVYDAPVDATRTVRLLRLYARHGRVPGFSRLLVRAFSLSAGRYAQLYEDLRFARHVAPPGRDRPVVADAGITAFRRFRRDALRRAQSATLPEHVRAAMGWDGLLEPAALAS